MPLIESLIDVINTVLEVIKAWCAVKIATSNNKVAKINLGLEDKTKTHPIGFQIQAEEEDEEQNEED